MDTKKKKKKLVANSSYSAFTRGDPVYFPCTQNIHHHRPRKEERQLEKQKQKTGAVPVEYSQDDSDSLPGDF